MFLALLPSSQAFAPPQPANRPGTVALNGHKDVGGWFGPAAATVAGWTLAAQMAFASPLILPEQAGEFKHILLVFCACQIRHRIECSSMERTEQ